MQQSETVELGVLDSDLFPSREAVREFVAGPGFDALSQAVGSAFSAARDVAVPACLAGDTTSTAAAFTLMDLTTLAAAAAAPGSKPLHVADSKGQLLTQRVHWLSAILALGAAYGMTAIGDLGRVINEHMERIERRELEGVADAG